MATILHMDTEEVRSLASQIQQSLGEIESRLEVLAAELQALDWISPGRDQFQGDFAQMLRAIASLKQSGDELSARLNSTASNWETAAEWGMGDVLGLATQMDDLLSSSPEMSASASLNQPIAGIENGIWSLGGSLLGGIAGWVSTLPPFNWFKENETPSPSAPTPTPVPTPTPAPTPQPDQGGVNQVNSDELPNGNPQSIFDAIQGLDVEHHFLPSPEGKTYCNIFAYRVAESLDIPLPEYLDWPGTAQKIDDYLNANEIVNWLRGNYQHGVPNGRDLGWVSVDQTTATEYAQKGYMVLAGWENPISSDPGHIAVVRPDSTADQILIAQAGGDNGNFESGSLERGFGNRSVEFFAFIPPKN